MFGLDLGKLQQELNDKTVQLQNSITIMNSLLSDLVKELKRLNENLEKTSLKTGL